MWFGDVGGIGASSACHPAAKQEPLLHQRDGPSLGRTWQRLRIWFSGPETGNTFTPVHLQPPFLPSVGHYQED